MEENIEPSKKQLRGGSRSMAALAPWDPIIRFPDDEEKPLKPPIELPVSPGISEDVDPEDLPCLVANRSGSPPLMRTHHHLAIWMVGCH